MEVTFTSTPSDKRLWAVTDDDDLEPGRWHRVPWEEIDDEELSLRDRVFNAFEYPFSSLPAKLIFTTQILLILISIVALLMETIPQYNPDIFPKYSELWWVVELVVTVIFTIEIVLRIALAKNRAHFIKKPTTISDFLSIVPFYAQETFSAEGRNGPDLLKLCRLFRMLKFFRNFTPIENLIRALEKSAQALLAPFMFLVACLLVMSSAMYFLEKGTYDDSQHKFLITDSSCNSKPSVYFNDTCEQMESQFISIPHTMWWSIVTMTTVGYGDMVPVTALGKMVGSLSMMLGIMFMAMPIAIVGSYFTVVVDVNTETKLLEKAGLEHDPYVSSGPRTPRGSPSSPLNPYARRGSSVPNIGLGMGGLGTLSSGRFANAKREAKRQLARRMTKVGAAHVKGFEAQLDGTEQLTKGEALAVFLRQVLPEYDHVWLASCFVHHLDIWLDTNAEFHVTERLDESLVGSNNSPALSRQKSGRIRADTIMGLPTFGCLEQLQKVKTHEEFPPKIVWLVKPMSFTVGSRCGALPDPDIVLCAENDHTQNLRVSQRHAEIIVSKWWSDKPTCKLRPILPSRLTINGKLVTHGQTLKHNDEIDFCPDVPNGPLKYRYRIDRYTQALQEPSLALSESRLAELREEEASPGLPLKDIALEGSRTTRNSLCAPEHSEMLVQRHTFGASTRTPAVEKWVHQIPNPDQLDPVAEALPDKSPLGGLSLPAEGSMDSDEDDLGGWGSIAFVSGAGNNPLRHIDPLPPSVACQSPILL
eukprot:TRINITY_DN1607_c0_g1_i3.p1 TRINITY_DN1607_c0_g1~~TRINITY_DN1607_c0_g1_i3.p1  ORF type:complete len:890 (+),score=174.24 TRINITY_DN1607_c0_g1_i3:394-2670(+)